MLVSTIIPVHNRAKLLQEAVQSVLDQTYSDIEVIIIDDGSSDNTADVISKLCNTHPQIRSSRIANSGPGAAREAGRQLAKGDFIQYLDSDDVLMPNKFRVQIKALSANPNAGIAYGITQHAGLDGECFAHPYKRTGENFTSLLPALLRSRIWCTHTPLYRRSITDQIGAWAELSNEEDWEYDMRAARLNTQLVYCDEHVSTTRYHTHDRLHLEGISDPVKLLQRAKARTLIYQHALAAGATAYPEDWHYFIKSLFLLARQCGQAGLANESQQLCLLAKEGAQEAGIRFPKLNAYIHLAKIFGWKTVARLAR